MASSCLLPLSLGVVYVVLIASHIGDSGGGFGSLDAVSRLFQNQYLLLAGWIHYLAFDLMVGCWEWRDARLAGISHLFVAPCLLLTFLLGPAGLLLYTLVRWTLKREFTAPSLR